MLAQDVHFSMYDKSISFSNPSLIAIQENVYNLVIQRRSQWYSVTTPFNTACMSFSAKNIFKRFSYAITLLSDQAGDSRFATDGGSLSLAKSIKYKKNNIFTGVQLGFYQRSISYDNLVFLQTEQTQNIKKFFLDFSLGITMQTTLDSNEEYLISISAYHLNKPNQSLTYYQNVFLPIKYVLLSKYLNQINTKVDFCPKLYASFQGRSNEILVGFDVLYNLNDDFSLISSIQNRLNDAMVFACGVKKENTEIVLSYDINTSSFSRASESMGGVEFSLSYGWDIIYRKKLNKPKCPIYL